MTRSTAGKSKQQEKLTWCVLCIVVQVHQCLVPGRSVGYLPRHPHVVLHLFDIKTYCTLTVLWRCWLAGREGIRPVKRTEWWGAGMVICLELDADLHMPQWMPLPLTVSCFSKIQIGFTFLVPAHLGSPGKKAVKRVCVHLQWHLVTHLHRHSCFAHGLAGYSWSASYNISSWESLGTSGTIEQHTFQQQNSAEADRKSQYWAQPGKYHNWTHYFFIHRWISGERTLFHSWRLYDNSTLHSVIHPTQSMLIRISQALNSHIT